MPVIGPGSDCLESSTAFKPRSDFVRQVLSLGGAIARPFAIIPCDALSFRLDDALLHAKPTRVMSISMSLMPMKGTMTPPTP